MVALTEQEMPAWYEAALWLVAEYLDQSVHIILVASCELGNRQFTVKLGPIRPNEVISTLLQISRKVNLPKQSHLFAFLTHPNKAFWLLFKLP